eukprot:360879-Heterocapsa_arctica.AAC.1
MQPRSSTWICHGRSATESSYHTPACATEVGAMILDKIEVQSLVSGLEEKEPEQYGEDLGHDGGDEEACRGGATRPRSSPATARPGQDDAP